MKKLLTLTLAVAFAFGVFVPLASAKNYDTSFKLKPVSGDGNSGFSGKRRKGDADPFYYVTTESGTVISNNLKYKVRARAIEGSNYEYASKPSKDQKGKIKSLAIKYYDPYLSEITSGNYRKHYYILAASLHSGDPDKAYTLKGKWNP